MKKIRILLVDNPSVMRSALARILNDQPDMEVVGETTHPARALQLCRRHKPNLVLMEFRLPGNNGPRLAVRFRTEFPQARLLVFSVSNREEDIWRAMQAEATGYVSKSAETPEMFDAIRAVAAGRNYFPASVIAKFDARRTRKSLSSRELQVLKQIVAGRSNKEIMADLRLSEGTVKLHVSNILFKMKVLDRTQAVVEAFRRGIISLEE